MNDREYETLLTNIDHYAERLMIKDLEHSNALGSRPLTLKETLIEMISDLEETTSTINHVLFELATFLDKRYGTFPKLKKVMTATKEPLKPWNIKP